MKLELELMPQGSFAGQQRQSNPVGEFVPNSIEEMLKAGIRYAKDGNRVEARRWLTRVTEIKPESETAWMWLASISEYPEELLVFLQKVLNVNPENERALEWTKATKGLLAKTFVERGAHASQENRRDFAVQCFMQALLHDNQNETAWLALASNSDSSEEKIKHLQKVLEINSENETALASLTTMKHEASQQLLKQANFAAISGNREEARNLLADAMRDAPELEDAWILKAYLADDSEEKIACYEKILLLNPDNEAAQAGLASLKMLLEKTNEPTNAKAIREMIENAQNAGAEAIKTEEDPFELEIEQPLSIQSAEDNLEASEIGLVQEQTESEDILFAEAEPIEEFDFAAMTEAGKCPFGFDRLQNESDENESESFNDLQNAGKESNESAFFNEQTTGEESFDLGQIADLNVSDDSSSNDFVSEDLPAVMEFEETGAQESPLESLPFVEQVSSSVEANYAAESPDADLQLRDFENADVAASIHENDSPDVNHSSDRGGNYEQQPEDSQTESIKSSSLTLDCPFCLVANEPQAFICHSCKTMLSLSDMEMLLAHSDAQTDVLTMAIEDLEAEKDSRELSEAELTNLGIAYLNVKNLRKGLNNLQEAARLNPNNVVLASKANFLAIRLAELEAHESRNENTAAAKNLTILVVDDSPTVRKLISGKLEKSGHTVVCAADGREALAQLIDITPDLILLDIMMPHMDGYQVCKLIRGNEPTKDVPVIMISGKDGFFDKVRGRMAGTSGYITKPFGPETLMKTIETYVV